VIQQYSCESFDELIARRLASNSQGSPVVNAMSPIPQVVPAYVHVNPVASGNVGPVPVARIV
jgi:hypothetical protein